MHSCERNDHVVFVTPSVFAKTGTLDSSAAKAQTASGQEAGVAVGGGGGGRGGSFTAVTGHLINFTYKNLKATHMPTEVWCWEQGGKSQSMGWCTFHSLLSGRHQKEEVKAANTVERIRKIKGIQDAGTGKGLLGQQEGTRLKHGAGTSSVLVGMALFYSFILRVFPPVS